MKKKLEERKMKEKKIELNIIYYFYLLLQTKFIILTH